MAADVSYLVSTILDVKTVGGKKAQSFANGIVASGKRIQGLGASVTRSIFSMQGAMVGLAGAYGIGRLIQGAIDANREIENLNVSIATTLQLFGRNKGAGGSSEMFAANMAEASAATDKLFRIAATSPASFQQAQALFQNILPGVAQVEGSMENMLEFTKKALSVGTLLGGDFKQAGADLRRMLTGQAGMDVRAWAEGMSTAVRRAAIVMGGDFKKLAKLGGDKFTKAFNKLDPQKRYKLMQEALKDLGASTEAAGKTWDGMTSAIKSDFFLLTKAFGEATFGTLKKQFKDLVGEGGIANPLSKSFAQLELAAKVAGSYVGDAASYLLTAMTDGADYVANNWESIASKLAFAFDKGLKAAKLFLAFRATAMVAGAGVSVMGKGFKGAQSLASNVAPIGAFVTALGGIVPVLGILLPIVLILGAALAGLGVAFAGVAAYFIEHWDDIIKGIRNGTMQLTPFVTALGHLWAKLVALGESILGTKGTVNATDGLAKMMLIATEVVYGIIGAMSMFLRAAGWVQFAWNAISAGLKVIALGFVGIIEVILKILRDVLSVMPGTSGIVEGLDSAIASTTSSIDDLVGSIKGDMKDSEQFFRMADVFDEAYDKRGDFAKGLEDRLKKAVAAAQEGEGAGGRPPGVSSGNIVIHNLRVEQDLRNHDPDRIMGAFIRKLEKTVTNPTQAITQEDYGV